MKINFTTKILPTIILPLLLFILAQNAKAQAINPQDCRGNNVHLLVIDQTALYDKKDDENLRDWFIAVLKNLSNGERVILYSIEEYATDAERKFDACVPGCSEYKNENAQQWESNNCKKRTEIGRRVRFTNKFLTIIANEFRKGKEQNNSPIAETIIYILNNNAKANIVKLGIFSDMVEYSDFNRAITNFNASHVNPLLNRIDESLNPPSGRLKTTKISTYGFGKRLGSELNSNNIKPLSPDARNAWREFWTGFFQEKLGAQTPPQLEKNPSDLYP